MLNSTPKQPPKQRNRPNNPTPEPSPEPEATTSAPPQLTATHDRLGRRAIAEFRDELEGFCRYASLSEVLLLTEALRVSALNRDLRTGVSEDCPIADAMAVLAWG